MQDFDVCRSLGLRRSEVQGCWAWDLERSLPKGP